jgi:hypothetical protein
VSRQHRWQTAAHIVLSLAAFGGVGALAPTPAHAETTDRTLTVLVLRDEDRDSTYDVGTDLPQSGIAISVTDGAGGSVRGLTDDAGRFLLRGTDQLAGGRYRVVAAIPPALSELTPVAASQTFASFSSTVDVTRTDQTLRLGVAAPAAASLSATATDPTTAPPATPVPRPERFAVGDRVWLDADRSGVQDPGEAPAPGVSVQLLDADGTVVAATISTDAGRFLFDDLAAGTYAVRVAGVPPGYRLAPTGATSDPGADSDPDHTGTTPPFTLGRDEPTVRRAGPADGVRAAYVNATVDAGIAPLRYAIGAQVWLDADGDGRQQPDEPPAAAEVSLLVGDRVVATTSTDAEGRYRFAGLMEGRYRVRFTAGEHRRFTAPHTGSDPAPDSDPDPRTGVTQEVTLGPDASDLVPTGEPGLSDADLLNASLGAGLVGAYAIGDTVWRDENGNGVRDAGDGGVPGVRVDLLGPDQRVLGRTVTSSTGTYGFSELSGGSYRLRFRPPAGGGLVFTLTNRGTSEAVDSDAGGDGLTAPVELNDDNPDDPTADAGLVTPAARSEAPPVDPGPVVATDTRLSSTGGVAVTVPLVGLALVVGGLGCLAAARRPRRR